MIELDINSKWFCYVILGKVDSKKESLHYLVNWMQCFYLIDDFLEDCPSKSLISEQTKERIIKIDKNFVPQERTTKAPTGGILQWNQKNNEKICTLYLQDQYIEIIEIEKNGKDYYDWLIDQFPSRDLSIKFHSNCICGYLSDNIDIKKTSGIFPDFLLTLSPTFNPNKKINANTELQIYISERYLKMKGIANVDNFVREIGKIAKAIKIGRALIPYQKNYTDETGRICVRGYVSYNFADRNTLELSKIGIKNWETL